MAKHSGLSLPLLGRQTKGLLSLWLKGNGQKKPPYIKKGITKRHALRKTGGPFAKKIIIIIKGIEPRNQGPLAAPQTVRIRLKQAFSHKDPLRCLRRAADLTPVAE